MAGSMPLGTVYASGGVDVAGIARGSQSAHRSGRQVITAQSPGR